MKKNTKTQILKDLKQVLDIEGRAILNLKSMIDKNFVYAVEKLFSCKGRAVIIGIGKSGLIARKIASTMSSVGTPSMFLHPVECLHGDLGVLTSSDIVIALSYSGQTQEINNLIPVLRNMGIYVIAMTGAGKSRLAKLSDLVLHTVVKCQACPYAPTASTAVMLAAGDALAVALMKLKNFDKNDFARLHPAGSLGKILTLKVKDLMIKGRSNPVISENSTIKKALIVMTKTRIGAVSVVDGSGKLTGFFTDGDLRRNLQRGCNVLNLKLSQVMTKNPITISPDTMASDAARIINTQKIDNIAVVDDKKRPVGILDEKNLLEIFPVSDEV